MTTLPRTDIDLRDELNHALARVELLACETDGQFAAWARKWGEATINAIAILADDRGWDDDWGTP